MDQDQDFSKLRNLLALKKLDMPMDTQIDQFLIEFHRRQRAQLLVPASPLARAAAWIKERVAGLELVPSLSYASGIAAVAILAVVGFSRQVESTAQTGQPSMLSLQMTPHDSAFALIPTSFASASSSFAKVADSLNSSPSRSDSGTTRFVLATNSNGAHDATVAF